jgi:pimeloyl-ACP methyl ester carboxylesterase
MIVADGGCRFWTRTTGSGSQVICGHGGPGWWDVLDVLAAILAKNGRSTSGISAGPAPHYPWLEAPEPFAEASAFS